jgi:uncharacterized protein (DUF433 family)
MKASELVMIDPDILGGTPVFKGTRFPTKALFDYLADGLSLDYFLESFPSVSRDLAVGILRNSRRELEHHAESFKAGKLFAA